MTTKKEVKKTYKLEDFFTKTLNQTATKMPLLFDGDDTGCYLMVKGIECKEAQRDRIIAQVAYADMHEESEKITDKVERAEFDRDIAEGIQIKLAASLVNSWSFGEMDGKQKLIELLCENKGLSMSVIAHATTAGNYKAKK